MDRYLDRTTTRSRSYTRMDKAAHMLTKMADGAHSMIKKAGNAEGGTTKGDTPTVSTKPLQAGTAQEMSTEENTGNVEAAVTAHTVPHIAASTAPHAQSAIDYTLLAQAVADLLRPMIKEMVAGAMTQDIQHLTEIKEQAKQMADIQQRVATAEEEIQEDHVYARSMELHIQQLTEKLGDIENRSRRNNIRIVGLPESIKTAALFKICNETIPKELGINRPCTVERAHRLGGIKNDRPHVKP